VDFFVLHECHISFYFEHSRLNGETMTWKTMWSMSYHFFIGSPEEVADHMELLSQKLDELEQLKKEITELYADEARLDAEIAKFDREIEEIDNDFE